MKVENISLDEAEAELERTANRGKYTPIISRVKLSNQPVKVSGLSRGQVAALIRRAREEGLRCRGNYKEGYVILAPQP